MAKVGAGLGVIAVILVAPLPALAQPGPAAADHPALGAQAERTVRALIVQYRPGVAPRTADGAPCGASRVTGPLRTSLRLGSGLGLNMWRVDFTTPVTLAEATRVARQLASHPSVVFAEPDSAVGVAR